MSATSAAQAADGPTEEQLRRYEEELRQITSAQVVLQSLASLITIGSRKLGLAPGTEQERDLEQARDAIDAARALLPVAERRMAPAESRQLKDALSQLQMGYARLARAAATGPDVAGGEPAVAGTDATAPHEGDEPGATGRASAQPGGAEPAGPAGQGGAAGDAGEGDGKGRSGEARDGGENTPGSASHKGPGPAEASGRLWVPGRG